MRNLINYLIVRENIKQNGSVLIFNPVPKDKAIEKNLINNWIKSSIKKAKEKSINGKELTPFLITEINTLSKNETLNANMELIINNALVSWKVSI